MAEYCLVMNLLERNSMRKQRKFRDRENPFDFEDNILLLKYRFPRHALMAIIEKFRPFLTRKTLRSNAIPVHLQVLVALRFYASGSFQHVTGDVVNISQSSVCRVVNSITNLLCNISRNYIRFPSERHEMSLIQQKFQMANNFPKILGVVDGTLINIKSPGGVDEPIYVSRKGLHAINVQIVCDCNMKVTDVVSKWPGSTHDSFIWTNSELRNKLLENQPNGWLLGDSGYPLEPWLLTPILRPNSNIELKYNKSHKKTRRIVENTIGLMKSVFRCIDNSGGILCYSPSKVCKIVVAVVVLHNMRRSLNLIEDNAIIETLEVENESSLETESEVNFTALHTLGTIVRNNLITNRFN
jgi:hypothetical protein